MAEEIARGVRVGDHAFGHRRNEAHVEHVAQGFLAVENPGVAGDNAVDDAVLHVADDRRHDLADRDVGAGGCAGERARFVGPEIKAEEHGFRCGDAGGSDGGRAGSGGGRDGLVQRSCRHGWIMWLGVGWTRSRAGVVGEARYSRVVGAGRSSVSI